LSQNIGNIARNFKTLDEVYGPDFSSTGAYHLQAPFLKGNVDYIIRVEIAAINSKQPQNKIADEFILRTII